MTETVEYAIPAENGVVVEAGSSFHEFDSALQKLATRLINGPGGSIDLTVHVSGHSDPVAGLCGKGFLGLPTFVGLGRLARSLQRIEALVPNGKRLNLNFIHDTCFSKQIQESLQSRIGRSDRLRINTLFTSGRFSLTYGNTNNLLMEQLRYLLTDPTIRVDICGNDSLMRCIFLLANDLRSARVASDTRRVNSKKYLRQHFWSNEPDEGKLKRLIRLQERLGNFHVGFFNHFFSKDELRVGLLRHIFEHSKTKAGQAELARLVQSVNPILSRTATVIEMVNEDGGARLRAMAETPRLPGTDLPLVVTTALEMLGAELRIPDPVSGALIDRLGKYFECFSTFSSFAPGAMPIYIPNR